PTTTAPASAAPVGPTSTSLLDRDGTAVDGTGSDGTATAMPSAGRTGSAWRSVAGWTVSGFAIVVGLLVLAGAGLAAWSLWSSRPSVAPATAPSQNHPAVRARQRAERIAAAHAEAQKT